MRSIRNMMRHPSGMVEDMADQVMERTRQMAKRPAVSGGLIMLILGIVGFIYVFPEIRRYMRMERM